MPVLELVDGLHG